MRCVPPVLFAASLQDNHRGAMREPSNLGDVLDDHLSDYHPGFYLGGAPAGRLAAIVFRPLLPRA